MEKYTETYYKAKDGTKFETEEECAAYETEEKRYRAALAKKNEAEKEIAVIEYARFKRSGGYTHSAIGSIGCGHDGFYKMCPFCNEQTGGYEGANLHLKVGASVYKCEKCGKFFSYA